MNFDFFTILLVVLVLKIIVNTTVCVDRFGIGNRIE